MRNKRSWGHTITSESSPLHFNLKEVWAYRDLLYMLVKRDFISFYKQTVLGPVWFFLQPVFTTIVFIFVFGNLANISTNDIPQPLFYLIGITVWNYFSDSILNTSTVLTKNAQLFNKVYFPRLILPLSVVISGFLKFGVQFSLFVLVLVYYYTLGYKLEMNYAMFLFPVSIILVAMLGMGMGTIVAAVTSRYRDLIFLVSFGVQLLMYGTTVAYPLSSVPEKYKFLISLNPLTGILETTRYGFFSKGNFQLMLYLYSLIFSIFVLILGVYVFSKREKNIVDTL